MTSLGHIIVWRMKHEKGINISHVIIENMGSRDQSQVKIKFKKFEKIKSVPKDIPKSHNDDSHYRSLTQPTHSQIQRPTSVPVPLNCSLSWFSQPPMLTNLCSMFSTFLCHDHVLSHLHFMIMMILLTDSPTLVPLLTHSLLSSIFS